VLLVVGSRGGEFALPVTVADASAGELTTRMFPAQGMCECRIMAETIGHGRSTRVDSSWLWRITLAEHHAGGTGNGRRRLATAQMAPIVSTAALGGVATNTGSIAPHSTHRAPRRVAWFSARSVKRCRHDRTVRSSTRW